MREVIKRRTGERTSRARAIVRSVLRFSPGEGHFVPCTDAQDQERMRVILMTERKNLEREDPEIMSKVRITKETVQIDDRLGPTMVVKVYRADEIGEELLTFNADGDIRVERILQEFDPLIMEQLESFVDGGGKLDDAPTHSFFSMFPQSDVEIAVAHMRKKLEKDTQG